MSNDTKSKLAQALRLIADAIEAENPPPAQNDPADQWIDEPTMLAQYGMGRSAADARGIPRTRLGRRNHWRRSDIEASIVATPVAPRAKTIRSRPVDDGDEIDALIASGAVRK